MRITIRSALTGCAPTTKGMQGSWILFGSNHEGTSKIVAYVWSKIANSGSIFWEYENWLMHRGRFDSSSEL